MNEDHDLNESLASEAASEENVDAMQNDNDAEGLGEAVIAAALGLQRMAAARLLIALDDSLNGRV